MSVENISYWSKKRAKLKKKFRILTDEDLTYNIGKEDEMMEMIVCKLGISKQELLNIILDL
jgi:hypothetical protein